jgi:hypothetical protein
MSTDRAPVTYPRPPAPQPAVPGPRPWFTSRDLGPAAVILIGLAAIGAVLGLIWQEISPRTRGFVYLPNAVIPEEKESLVASDGRFLLLTCAAGIVVAVAAWLRRSARGPATALALVLGGLLGALLTDFVGRLASGGHDGGALNAVITLPVRVHARGLLLIEPALAAFVYAACTLFAKRDDLGVDEPESGYELDGAPKLLAASPAPGEVVTGWLQTRSIAITLDRAIVGPSEWVQVLAVVREGEEYDPLLLEPPVESVRAEGGFTYTFTLAEPPADLPVEILVQLGDVDARGFGPRGDQWTFTVIAGDSAP